MRAIWKGAVSFGLVSVPVKLYAATESHDVSFRQVHAKDGGRIKYQRVCSIDGEEVAYADIAKGYETEDGEMVILTDDDMAELPSTSSREIAVEKFVPTDQIDPMLFEKSYYLEPEKSGAKPYAPAAPGAARRRPDGGRHGRAAPAHHGRRAAGPRRRDRAPDDDVARRDPHPRLLGRDRRGQGRRGQDGAHAGRDPGRRLRRRASSRTTTPRPSRPWSRPRSRAARSSAPPPRPSPPARSSTCSPRSSGRWTPPRRVAATPARRSSTTSRSRRTRSPPRRAAARRRPRRSRPRSGGQEDRHEEDHHQEGRGQEDGQEGPRAEDGRPQGELTHAAAGADGDLEAAARSDDERAQRLVHRLRRSGRRSRRGCANAARSRPSQSRVMVATWRPWVSSIRRSQATQSSALEVADEDAVRTEQREGRGAGAQVLLHDPAGVTALGVAAPRPSSSGRRSGGSG